MLYEVMITVATFDILPSDLILPALFPKLDREEPFSDKFERLGFETQYIIMNLGTMFFILCMNFTLLALYMPLKLLGLKFRPPKVLAKKIGKVMFFQWQVVFIQEAYLDLFLAVVINFFSFSGSWATG